jgi:hypothetical protein
MVYVSRMFSDMIAQASMAKLPSATIKGFGESRWLVSESVAATSLYQECPHCKGEGYVTIPLPEDSSLLAYLDGDARVVKVCPHCIRRSVVPAFEGERPSNPVRRRRTVKEGAKVSESTG